jgi:O-methyltransferase involved in polyketide biosynthesis
VFVTAQGLFMYFTEQEVRGLVTAPSTGRLADNLAEDEIVRDPSTASR